MGRANIDFGLWQDLMTLCRCEITFFALFAIWGYVFQLQRYPQAVGIALFLVLVWRGTYFHWYLAFLLGSAVFLGMEQQWAWIALPVAVGAGSWWLRRLIIATRALRPTSAMYTPPEPATLPLIIPGRRV